MFTPGSFVCRHRRAVLPRLRLRWLLVFLPAALFAAPLPPAEGPLSPIALAASSDGARLFIGCETAQTLLTLDVGSGRIIRTTALPGAPSGIAFSADGGRLFVTCAGPASVVCVVDPATGAIASRIPAGHTAVAPVPGPDGRFLYVCNRFDNAVAVLDLAQAKEVARIPVPREPIAAALAPDGRRLFVAHHIHEGRADAAYVAAGVSIIDTATRAIVQRIRLPNGSGLLRDIRISPEGRFAAVTHLLSRFHLPTTQLERGWMNTNALSVLDVARGEWLNTVLLDNVNRGAANPWAIAWSADAGTLCVTHAGTHEISVIDARAMLTKLTALAPPAGAGTVDPDAARGARAAAVPNDLAFLVGIRRRVRSDGQGPRAIAVAGGKAYVANYFSDTLTAIDLAVPGAMPVRIPLGPGPVPSMVRRGEMLWNDGSICFQGWQSCSSCHSSDARVDGLNWDLLNDGIASPKNAKSLLFAHETPPAMSTGVRQDAFTAVRAGIKHILFAVRPPEDAAALDAYLQSLRPVPSPHLINGRLSAAAHRGQKLFASEAVGCARCHAGPLFTDLKSYEVGTASATDLPGDEFDTPTLIELWRSGPYLHDGSAATMRDVLTTRNEKNRHGATQHLTPPQLDDLAAYLLSL